MLSKVDDASVTLEIETVVSWDPDSRKDSGSFRTCNVEDVLSWSMHATFRRLMPLHILCYRSTNILNRKVKAVLNGECVTD